MGGKIADEELSEDLRGKLLCEEAVSGDSKFKALSISARSKTSLKVDMPIAGEIAYSISCQVKN